MKKKQATSLPVRRLHCNESADICHATRRSSCLATRCSSCLATARCRARLGDSRFLEQRPHSPPASSITGCWSSPANTKPNSTSTRVVFKERVQILKSSRDKKNICIPNNRRSNSSLPQASHGMEAPPLSYPGQCLKQVNRQNKQGSAPKYLPILLKKRLWGTKAFSNLICYTFTAFQQWTWWWVKWRTRCVWCAYLWGVTMARIVSVGGKMWRRLDFLTIFPLFPPSIILYTQTPLLHTCSLVFHRIRNAKKGALEREREPT